MHEGQFDRLTVEYCLLPFYGSHVEHSGFSCKHAHKDLSVSTSLRFAYARPEKAVHSFNNNARAP